MLMSERGNRQLAALVESYGAKCRAFLGPYCGTAPIGGNVDFPALNAGLLSREHVTLFVRNSRRVFHIFGASRPFVAPFRAPIVQMMRDPRVRSTSDIL